MSRRQIFHALGLHLHQPPGNLGLLLETAPDEARRIVGCYERIARHAQKYANVARLHLTLSGPLLRQLRDPDLVAALADTASLPDIVAGLGAAPGVEFLGSGLEHPPMPLIPSDDWADQLAGERQYMRDVLGKAPRGFWPAEGLFSLEMVPALVDAGFDYVVLNAGRLARPDGTQADAFRPGLLRYRAAEIAVVPLDGDLSAMQAGGIDPAWWADEIKARSLFGPEPRLITTVSDGENGAWFRDDSETGFFARFFSPYMEFCETGEFPVKPISLSEFLDIHPPTEDLTVHDNAPVVGSTKSFDVDHWTDAPDHRREDLARLFRISGRYRQLSRGPSDPEPLRNLRRLILEAEGSCFLVWDDAWRDGLRARLDEAERLLDGPVTTAILAPGGPPPSITPPEVTRPRPAATAAAAKPKPAPGTATPEPKPRPARPAPGPRPAVTKPEPEPRPTTSAPSPKPAAAKPTPTPTTPTATTDSEPKTPPTERPRGPSDSESPKAKPKPASRPKAATKTARPRKATTATKAQDTSAAKAQDTSTTKAQDTSTTKAQDTSAAKVEPPAKAAPAGRAKSPPRDAPTGRGRRKTGD